VLTAAPHGLRAQALAHLDVEGQITRLRHQSQEAPDQFTQQSEWIRLDKERADRALAV